MNSNFDNHIDIEIKMMVIKSNMWNNDDWKYPVISDWVELATNDMKVIEMIGEFQIDWIVTFEDQEYGEQSKYKYLFRDEQKAILFALKYC